ncbi:MAG: lipid-A-disaccharide synthase [Vicingaceae bacterium]|nr:MAG: lipid-A-disaccharide synthase [Vicingaceae bacterium]
MKYFILTGEPSGDMHAANLAMAIKKYDENAILKGWGGDRLANAGVEILKPIEELSFMGFWEVVSHLPKIRRNFHDAYKQIIEYHPDVVVLVDFPGFNLRMAKWAKKRGFKVVYYISPQLWAWKESRVNIVKQYVDKMLVILPFEQEFYKKHGVEAIYVGHPLLDELEKKSIESREGLPAQYIALLPGSRKQEVEHILPVMLSASASFNNFRIIIAASNNIEEDIYRKIAGNKNVSIIYNDTYRILKHARVAWVTSGTATLETALIGTPQIVCYKGSVLSYWLARRLVKVKYISLVNLILDKPLVKELIQHDLNEKNLINETKKILESSHEEKKIIDGYEELKNLLKSNISGPSDKAANIIVQLAKEMQ